MAVVLLSKGPSWSWAAVGFTFPKGNLPMGWRKYQLFNLTFTQQWSRKLFLSYIMLQLSFIIIICYLYIMVLILAILPLHCRYACNEDNTVLFWTCQHTRLNCAQFTTSCALTSWVYCTPSAFPFLLTFGFAAIVVCLILLFKVCS